MIFPIASAIGIDHDKRNSCIIALSGAVCINLEWSDDQVVVLTVIGGLHLQIIGPGCCGGEGVLPWGEAVAL